MKYQTGCSTFILFFIVLFFITVLTIAIHPVLCAVVVISSSMYWFFLSIKIGKDIKTIKKTKTSKIKDIDNLHRIIKEEIGTDGYLNMMVVVEGTISTDQECVMGHSRKIKAKDDQFYVRDGTGKILVKVDNPPVFYDNDGRILKKEYFSIDKQILRIIGGFVYIMGEASCENGELMIKHPKDDKENFVVAFMSKKELVQHLQKQIQRCILGGIFTLLFGIVVLK